VAGHKTGDRLLVVLTEGEFRYADGSAPAAALPPSLRGAFTGEPRWIDLRWLHDSEQVAQSNLRLRNAVADIAAALRAVPKDDLVGEHIRQHRWTMRLARSAVALLVVLLLVAVSAAFYGSPPARHPSRRGARQRPAAGAAARPRRAGGEPGQ
jgi:hypothetical protein